MKAYEILERIEGLPLDAAAEYSEKRSVLLTVARVSSEENAQRWPFLNPHKHCLSQIRRIENANGELDAFELMSAYEEIAKRYVNDSARW